MFSKLLITIIGILIMICQPACASTTPQLYGAHRGERWPNPYTQNSTLAINAAINDSNVWFIESDVRATNDNLGIMQHDADLTISTNCTGMVSDYSRAYLLSQCRMNDGSVPQTVEDYVTSIVSAHKHAILHVKIYTAAFRSYLIKVLQSVPGARLLIRIGLQSAAQINLWKAEIGSDWYYEFIYTNEPPADAGTISNQLGTNVRTMLAPYALSGAMPSTWLTPFKDYSRLDICTYNYDQDVQSHNTIFKRVLSNDIAATKAA